MVIKNKYCAVFSDGKKVTCNTSRVYSVAWAVFYAGKVVGHGFSRDQTTAEGNAKSFFYRYFGRQDYNAYVHAFGGAKAWAEVIRTREQGARIEIVDVVAKIRINMHRIPKSSSLPLMPSSPSSADSY